MTLRQVLVVMATKHETELDEPKVHVKDLLALSRSVFEQVSIQQPTQISVAYLLINFQQLTLLYIGNVSKEKRKCSMQKL